MADDDYLTPGFTIPEPKPEPDPERLVTLWSRWPAGGWVIERSRPLRYWQSLGTGLSLTRPMQLKPGSAGSREWQLFEHGTNPNDTPKETT